MILKRAYLSKQHSTLPPAETLSLELLLLLLLRESSESSSPFFFFSKGWSFGKKKKKANGRKKKGEWSNGRMNVRLLHSLFTYHLRSLKTPIVHSKNDKLHIDHTCNNCWFIFFLWVLVNFQSRPSGSSCVHTHYTVENIWKSRSEMVGPSPELCATHSPTFREICSESAPHCYVMPYLQSADHMQFQIPNVNYPHYHNHLDTHTGRQQGSWQPVREAGQRPASHLDRFSGRSTPLTAFKCVSEYIILISQLCWPRSAESSPHMNYVQHFKWLLLTYLFSVSVRD